METRKAAFEAATKKAAEVTQNVRAAHEALSVARAVEAQAAEILRAAERRLSSLEETAGHDSPEAREANAAANAAYAVFYAASNATGAADVALYVERDKARDAHRDAARTTTGDNEIQHQE